MVTWDPIQLLNASSPSYSGFWKLLKLLIEYQLLKTEKKKSERKWNLKDNTNLKYGT